MTENQPFSKINKSMGLSYVYFSSGDGHLIEEGQSSTICGQKVKRPFEKHYRSLPGWSICETCKQIRKEKEFSPRKDAKRKMRIRDFERWEAFTGERHPQDVRI